MADSNSGVTPQTIPDVQIPILDTSVLNNNSVSTNGSQPSTDSSSGVTPASIPNAAIPGSPTVSDVIGQSLDTAQRKILGTYTFGKVGALEVGDYQPGVTGDIRISPDGIIGRDKNGLDYFTMNEDGIILTDGNNSTIFDSQGIRSTTQFQSFILQGTLGFSTNSTSNVDVPGSSLLPIIISRPVRVIYSLSIYGHNSSSITSNLANSGYVEIYDDVIGGQVLQIGNIYGAMATNTPDGIHFTISTFNSLYTFTGVALMNPGTHNLKLRASSFGGGTTFLNNVSVAVIILGS